MLTAKLIVDPSRSTQQPTSNNGIAPCLRTHTAAVSSALKDRRILVLQLLTRRARSRTYDLTIARCCYGSLSAHCFDITTDAALHIHGHIGHAREEELGTEIAREPPNPPTTPSAPPPRYARHCFLLSWLAPHQLVVGSSQRYLNAHKFVRFGLARDA